LRLRARGGKTTMDPEQFKENLLLYGADLDAWPEGVRLAGREALRRFPELRASFTEQEEFERVLKARKYEEPSGDLAGRIVSASFLRDQKARPGFGSFLPKIFTGEFLLPKPALVLGSTLMIGTLVLGFVIGFSIYTGPLPTEERQTNLQEFLHYQGNALWAKE
jgi:hypothetical protein